MSWTPERIETITRMAPTHSAREIGEAIGMTKNAVIGKLRRTGVQLGRGAAPDFAALGKKGGRASAAARSLERLAEREATKREKPAGATVKSVAVAFSNRRRAEAARLAAAPVPKIAAPPPAPVAPALSLGVTIADLRKFMCRWPTGDPSSVDFRYCGSHREGEGPYCSVHHAISYVPNSDRVRRRA